MSLNTIVGLILGLPVGLMLFTFFYLFGFGYMGFGAMRYRHNSRIFVKPEVVRCAVGPPII